MANAFLQRMQNDREWPWEEKARLELNEDPQTNEQKLSDLKYKISEYSKAHPRFRPQLDDRLLMAFLRTCKFDVELAMTCYKKFNKVRLCNPEKIFPTGKGPKNYMKYYEKQVVAVLRQRNPLDGTVVFVYSFRNFDASEDNLEDIFNAIYAILLEIVVDPSVQAHGIRFIIDYTGVNYAVMKSGISKMYLNKASQLAQESCPVLIKGIHAVEAPTWLVRLVNTVFRSLLSKQIRDMIHFHGSLEEVHEFISKEILPDIFGGTAGPLDETWMKEAIEEVHDEVVKKSFYGFIEF